MEEKRTKIVCTVGPASASPLILRRMIAAGMDAARLNFSHGTHAEHAALIRAVRQAAKKAGKTVAIIQDLQGPKIRLGKLPKGGVTLHKGTKVTITTASAAYQENGPLPLTSTTLHKTLRAGDRVLFVDGAIEGKVEKVRGKVITLKMSSGGTVLSHQGVNVPDTTLAENAFTLKDREDLEFGMEQGVDWVALSFVTTAADIAVARNVARSIARATDTRPPRILAKIERRMAVEHFEEILEAADGILIGRGDLGVEVASEEVPVIQKDITEACRLAGKPVIVATQMLESMVSRPKSTRAETSDVANAVFDHADAVMLSAESATGRYPAVTVQAMASVIREAEASRYDDIHDLRLVLPDTESVLAQTLHVLAQSRLIAAIVAVAAQGDIAQKLNMYRPPVPLLLVCPDAALARQMMLGSGVYPIVLSPESASFWPRLQALLRRERVFPRDAQLALVTSGKSGLAMHVVRV